MKAAYGQTAGCTTNQQFLVLRMIYKSEAKIMLDNIKFENKRVKFNFLACFVHVMTIPDNVSRGFAGWSISCAASRLTASSSLQSYIKILSFIDPT